ncbi:MAG TPA: TMEM175 family protein [Xanthobacteraceae bacterium]
MRRGRLEAFFDAVLAIIITIMVLELKAPHDAELEHILGLWPVFLSYLLSFVMLAIYWVNHHHIMHLVREVDARMLWANLLLLFWLSLFPFTTAYLGETKASPLAVELYAGVAFLSAASYLLVLRIIARASETVPEQAVLTGVMIRKNLYALAAYAASILTAFLHVPAALVLLVVPAVMYLRPDRNVEHRVKEHAGSLDHDRS